MSSRFNLDKEYIFDLKTYAKTREYDYTECPTWAKLCDGESVKLIDEENGTCMHDTFDVIPCYCIEKPVERQFLNNKVIEALFLAVIIVLVLAIFHYVTSSDEYNYHEAFNDVDDLYTTSLKEMDQKLFQHTLQIEGLEQDMHDIIQKNPAVVKDDIIMTDNERVLLYRLVHREAGNQPAIGQIYVLFTVFNRVASDSYPDTILEVVMQPEQFSCTLSDNFLDFEIPMELLVYYDNILEQSIMMYRNIPQDQLPLFYLNPKLASSEAYKNREANRPKLCAINDHVFYK